MWVFCFHFITGLCIEQNRLAIHGNDTCYVWLYFLNNDYTEMYKVSPLQTTRVHQLSVSRLHPSTLDLLHFKWQVSSNKRLFQMQPELRLYRRNILQVIFTPSALYLSKPITHNGNTHSIMLKLHQSSRPNTYVFLFSHVHEERTFSTIALADPWGHPPPNGGGPMIV